MWKFRKKNWSTKWKLNFPQFSTIKAFSLQVFRSFHHLKKIFLKFKCEKKVEKKDVKIFFMPSDWGKWSWKWKWFFFLRWEIIISIEGVCDRRLVFFLCLCFDCEKREKRENFLKYKRKKSLKENRLNEFSYDFFLLENCEKFSHLFIRRAVDSSLISSWKFAENLLEIFCCFIGGKLS